MVVGMFQSPLVPLATFWMDDTMWQPMGMSFLFSMLFLLRHPGIWWSDILFNSGLLVSFTLGTIFCSDCIPYPFQSFGLLGILSSAGILWMFSLPSARSYYFPTAKTT